MRVPVLGPSPPDDVDTQISTDLASEDGMELDESSTRANKRRPTVPVFQAPPLTDPAPSPDDATEDARPTLPNAPEDATHAPIAKDRPTVPNAPEDATHVPIAKDARPTLPNAPEDATHVPIAKDARPTIPNAPVPDEPANAPGFHKTYTASQDSQNPFPDEAMD